MSDRASWKMLHLLYTLRPGVEGLTSDQLLLAGINCNPDTVVPLLDGEAITVDASGIYTLTKAARKILQTCIVANPRWPGRDILVDQPKAFVVMPFSESWSDKVFQDMIQPALEEVGFGCVRGDTPPRVGDLAQTIWSALAEAGIVIADVSVPNPNVFYEIGLTHALGKDCFVIKQRQTTVPADFGGAHYYEYDLASLAAGKELLAREINTWASEQAVGGVVEIYK